jgi:hypothetical protein
VRRLALLLVPLLLLIAGCNASGLADDSHIYNPGEAAKAIKALEKKLGYSPQVTEANFYDTYAIFYVNDRSNRTHVDRYTYIRGGVESPEPVSLTEDETKSLESDVFPLAQVDPDAIPKLAALAQNQEIEGAKVSYMGLSRNGDGGPVLWHVYVTGTRQSTDFVADAHGNLPTAAERSGPLRDALPSILTQLRARLGAEPRIQEALLYPDYAIFTVQSPTDARAALNLDWRDGFFGGADREDLSIEDSNALPRMVFPAEVIQLAGLQKLFARAQALDGGSGEVQYARLARDEFRRGDPPVWNVYIKTDRGSRYIVGTPTGRFLELH